jgi:hypothetical protein
MTGTERMFVYQRAKVKEPSREIPRKRFRHRARSATTGAAPRSPPERMLAERERWSANGNALRTEPSPELRRELPERATLELEGVHWDD